jgi:hypothetical protein
MVSKAPLRWLLHKASWESCCPLAKVAARAAEADNVATDRTRATDEMAVFGGHP